jgi:hypothetical protein
MIARLAVVVAFLLSGVASAEPLAPAKALKVLTRAGIGKLRAPAVSATKLLFKDCKARGGCVSEKDEAKLKAFYLADAERIRPSLRPAEVDRLDCALGILGLAPAADQACVRGDASLAPNMAGAMAMAGPDAYVVFAAEGCSELQSCARGCSPFLAAMASADPADRANAERCPDAKGVPEKELGAWVLARTVTWMKSSLPYLEGEGKRNVEAAVKKLGE